MQETTVQFVVTDFQQAPKKVTDELGLRGAETWEVGEPRHPNSCLVHRENGFQIKAKKDQDFEEQVSDVLNTVFPMRKALSELRAHCELQCIFYLSESERPVIHFSESILEQLVQLRAPVDVDVYYVSSRELV
jgi:hypothetical protein